MYAGDEENFSISPNQNGEPNTLEPLWDTSIAEGRSVASLALKEGLRIIGLGKRHFVGISNMPLKSFSQTSHHHMHGSYEHDG